MTTVHEVSRSASPRLRTAHRAAYSVLATVSWAAVVLLLVLSIADADKSVGAALLDLVVVFSNLTLVLTAVVSTALAASHNAGVPRLLQIAMLTTMVMGAVTVVVNVVLQDPTLPDGWWGMVDLAEHYVVPLGLILIWLVLGPRLALAWAELPLVLVVPVVWLVGTLIRGELSSSYPYDFLDAAAHGYASVLAFAAGIILAMLALGSLFLALDHVRSGTRRETRAQE